MLVLSRRTGERIIIDNNIEVMVLAINGNQVRLGISAPANTLIMRPEAKVKIRKQDENLAASLR